MGAEYTLFGEEYCDNETLVIHLKGEWKTAKPCAVTALEVLKKSKLEKLVNLLISDRTITMPCIMQRRVTFKTRIDVIYVCITGTDGVLAGAASAAILLRFVRLPLSCVNIKFYECLQRKNLVENLQK
uniref:Uncharacterized protein n=1 Tax=Glossina austeni TaxID=7395 RepID=A0A1A9USG8_GLOAU